MNRRRKKSSSFRRLRFFILLVLIIAAGTMGWKFLSNQWSVSADPYAENPPAEDNDTDQESPSSPETEIEGENPLEESSYPEEIAAFVQLPYFIDENVERYMQYHEQNPGYSYETAITHVNIGLDKPHYTEVVAITKPGDTAVLVNKYHALPSDYAPENLEKISGTEYLLRHDARVAFEEMQEAAAALGLNLYPVSTYRSYTYQQTVYNRNLESQPQEEVDRFSARPGHSEHQLGLAVDVQATDTSVADTPEYAWYVEHAHEYGFIIRYPEGKDPITGYTYEPWHLRYLGIELATAVYESGLTYDEYYVQFLGSDSLLVLN